MGAGAGGTAQTIILGDTGDCANDVLQVNATTTFNCDVSWNNNDITDVEDLTVDGNTTLGDNAPTCDDTLTVNAATFFNCDVDMNNNDILDIGDLGSSGDYTTAAYITTGNITTVNSGTVNGVIVNSTNSLNVNGELVFASSTLTVNSTTPDVSTETLYYTANTVATDITDFTNGTTGQIIYIIIGDANTDFTDGSGLELNGNADWDGSGANDSITFIYDGTDWIEVARSDN